MWFIYFILCMFGIIISSFTALIKFIAALSCLSITGIIFGLEQIAEALKQGGTGEAGTDGGKNG